MKDRYVLDSSIWIELERGNPAISTLVQPFIDRNEVCVVDLIVAELLRGTKSRRDFDRLESAFADFVWLSADWERVAETAFRVARKGLNPPLTDLYIAQSVHDNDKVIVTQDKHFKQIAGVLPFKFVLL